tara:strand:- start:209 stop:1123 length:915 start_codon:yes stop_codon:yes gene_type:complete
MRVALCLYGLTGAVDFGYGLGKSIDPRIGHHHHLKHIIEPNNADVFIHSWNTEFEDLLVKLYEPKKHIIEPQIMFNPNSAAENSIISRWWSNSVVMDLKHQYEKENNFEYDWVILYRFDHVFLVDLKFEKFNNENIYFRHSNGLRAPEQYSHGYPGREKCLCYNKKGKYGTRLMDVFIFSNSRNMDKFASVYEWHQENSKDFNMSPHDECYAQLERENMQNKLDFAFHGYDPHAFKKGYNIMQCELIRALYETPEYVEGNFNIKDFKIIKEDLTNNPIVKSRFPGWGVPQQIKSKANQAGFKNI